MRVAVLDFGAMELALDVLIPGDGGGAWISIPVPGYLIQTDDGRTILVDTGLPPAYYADAAAAIAADGSGGWLRRVTATDGHRPAAQLALLGLTPDDVTDVVVTHTHFDHSGGLDDFRGATLIVQRAERELPRPLDHPPVWPEATYRVIDGDAEIAPGVRLLATPGHSPGHCSLLVSLPKTRSMLLAIDAPALSATLERDNFQLATDAEQARQSGHRVARLAAEHGADLIFGHDPDQWATLRKAPAWYE